MSSQLGWNQPGGEVLNFSSREKVVVRSSSRHEEPLRQGGPHVASRTHRAAVVIIVRANRWCAFGTVIAITLTRINTAGTSSVQHRHRRNQTGKMRKGVALNTDIEVVSMRIQFFQYSSGNTRT